MMHAKLDFTALGPVLVLGVITLVLLLISIPPVLAWLLFQMILPLWMWVYAWLATLGILALFYR